MSYVNSACHLPFPLEPAASHFQHSGVKSFRLIWFAAALLPGFASCSSPSENEYTRLRVTNPRGQVIADWVARGKVTETETGYRITALQRTDGYPYPVTARYPDGWRVTVVGPNVHRWPCAQPIWMVSDSEK